MEEHPDHRGGAPRRREGDALQGIHDARHRRLALLVRRGHAHAEGLAVGVHVHRGLDRAGPGALAAARQGGLGLLEGWPELGGRPLDGRALVAAGVELELVLGLAFLAADRLRPGEALEDAEHALLGGAVPERRVAHEGVTGAPVGSDAHVEADPAGEVGDALRAPREAGAELLRGLLEDLLRLALVERADLGLDRRAAPVGARLWLGVRGGRLGRRWCRRAAAGENDPDDEPQPNGGSSDRGSRLGSSRQSHSASVPHLSVPAAITIRWISLVPS